MSTTKKATLEDAWGIIAELGKAQKETDRQLKLKDTSREIKEAQTSKPRAF